jgi:hypothetical protein
MAIITTVIGDHERKVFMRQLDSISIPPEQLAALKEIRERLHAMREVKALVL